jgi:hypothetical protein
MDFSYPFSLSLPSVNKMYGTFMLGRRKRHFPKLFPFLPYSRCTRALKRKYISHCFWPVNFDPDDCIYSFFRQSADSLPDHEPQWRGTPDFAPAVLAQASAAVATKAGNAGSKSVPASGFSKCEGIWVF